MEVIGQLHVLADEMALEAGRTSLALRTTLSLFLCTESNLYSLVVQPVN